MGALPPFQNQIRTPYRTRAYIPKGALPNFSKFCKKPCQFLLFRGRDLILPKRKPTMQTTRQITKQIRGRSETRRSTSSKGLNAIGHTCLVIVTPSAPTCSLVMSGCPQNVPCFILAPPAPPTPSPAHPHPCKT